MNGDHTLDNNSKTTNTNTQIETFTQTMVKEPFYYVESKGAKPVIYYVESKRAEPVKKYLLTTKSIVNAAEKIIQLAIPFTDLQSLGRLARISKKIRIISEADNVWTPISMGFVQYSITPSITPYMAKFEFRALLCLLGPYYSSAEIQYLATHRGNKGISDFRDGNILVHKEDPSLFCLLEQKFVDLAIGEEKEMSDSQILRRRLHGV